MTFSEIARSATITADERKIDFEEELGISIFIPENSIPDECIGDKDEGIELFILPAFSGPFAGHEDLEPVSPAYLIKTNKELKFKRDITVRIKHNACLVTEQDCKDLVFMRADSTPLHRGPLFGPIYVFHELNRSKVRFSLEDGPFGEVRINQFSLFMIWRKLWRRVRGEGKM